MSGSSGEARDRLRMRDVMLPFRRTIADQDLRSALDPVECVSRLTRLADARLEVQVEPSSAVRLRARGYPLARDLYRRWRPEVDAWCEFTRVVDGTRLHVRVGRRLALSDIVALSMLAVLTPFLFLGLLVTMSTATAGEWLLLVVFSIALGAVVYAHAAVMFHGMADLVDHVLALVGAALEANPAPLERCPACGYVAGYRPNVLRHIRGEHDDRALSDAAGYSHARYVAITTADVFKNLGLVAVVVGTALFVIAARTALVGLAVYLVGAGPLLYIGGIMARLTLRKV